MTKKKFKKWLKGAVNDSFMDLFYYDRKNCEEMPLKTLGECIEKGWLSKNLLKKVFNKQIEKEYK